MDFPPFADMSINSSPSATPTSSEPGQVISSLDSFFLTGHSDDENYEELDIDSSEAPSPVVESPVHRRYLYPQKEFVDDLRPEELRWFYRSHSTKKWLPFIGYDSLRIECRYRALAVDKNGEIDVNERILVRGGLYEVDVVNKQCFPVYWTGDTYAIVRGTWFHETMQPLDEDYSCQIEAEHLMKFRGQKLEEAPTLAKGPKPVVHNMKFRDFHVDWNASNEIYMYSESTSSKLMRKVTKSIGMQKSGTRLHRCYCYEAQMDDKPPDITHLVFVIHGIGQKMDCGSIVRCVKDLRDNVSFLQQKLYPNFSAYNQRAEFLPVEWRSSLKLDGDTVQSITPHKMLGVRNILNSSAMDILYYTSPLYRSEITASLQAELIRLYQMFCSRHPYFEANGGKVSIVSHSLGSVIIFDIMTCWNPIQLYDQFVTSIIREGEKHVSQTKGTQSAKLLQELSVARQRVAELEATLEHVKECKTKEHPLPFKLENLFCLGSPLPVFLALRGIRPQGSGCTDHFLPKGTCNRLFNIYHPSDPVAYRFEPLVLKHYSTIRPLPIHYYNAAHRPQYSQMPRKAYAAFKGSPDDTTQKLRLEESSDSTEKNSSIDNLSAAAIVEKVESKASSVAKGFSLSKWFSELKARKPDEMLSAELKILRSMDQEAQRVQNTLQYPEPQDIDKTELEYRLDYHLKERSMENSYLSLLTSHTSYWANRDIALFLLVHLFPQLQEEGPP